MILGKITNSKTMNNPLTTLKSILQVGWRTESAPQSSAEQKELASDKPTPIETDQDDGDTPTEDVDTGDSPVAKAQVLEHIAHSGPTHPASPGVLSEFPPFEYRAPPARLEPLPLDADAAASPRTLGQKVLPLTSTLGRDSTAKKD